MRPGDIGWEQLPPVHFDMRSPYEIVATDWNRRPRAMSLDTLERTYKSSGFVFSTPSFYVMGRPVRKYAPIEHILDDTYYFDHDTCDTWFIAIMAGDIKAAWRILPWELPWMAWVRDNDPLDELRFYETRRLMRLSGVAP